MTAPVTIYLPGRHVQAVNELVADGARNTTIAARLGLNPGTIANYISAACVAAGVHSRAALATAVRDGRVVVVAVTPGAKGAA